MEMNLDSENLVINCVSCWDSFLLKFDYYDIIKSTKTKFKKFKTNYLIDFQTMDLNEFLILTYL